LCILPFVSDPYLAVIKQRLRITMGQEPAIFAYHEGKHAVTVAAGIPESKRSRQLLINGIGVTVLSNETKLLSHLPLLLADHPQTLLNICFGMGTSIRSASGYPNLKIDAVDLVPDVFDYVRYFHPDAEEWRHSPHIRYIHDDGRHFLHVRQRQYDVITIDPSPPLHSAGTVNLYTTEFLSLCKSHLTEKGIMCLWIPPDRFSEVAMIMKTFITIFPNTTLWGGLEFVGFYLIGTHHEMIVDNDLRRSLAQQISAIPEMNEWTKTYTDRDILFDLYLLSPGGLATMLRHVPLLTDDHPLTEFPLWRYFFDDHFHKEFNANTIRKYKLTADPARLE
jgi:spermidine synthase